MLRCGVERERYSRSHHRKMLGPLGGSETVRFYLPDRERIISIPGRNHLQIAQSQLLTLRDKLRCPRNLVVIGVKRT